MPDLAQQGVVAGIARDHVVEVRSGRAVYARERIVPDGCIAARRSSGEIDRDTAGRVEKHNSRVAVAGDGVVAAQAFELVEGADRAGVGARSAEAGRVVGVGKDRALDLLDRVQRVGSRSRSSPVTIPAARSTLIPTGHDGCVRRCSGGEAVEAAAAVDEVVAGNADEGLASYPAPLLLPSRMSSKVDP